MSRVCILYLALFISTSAFAIEADNERIIKIRSLAYEIMFSGTPAFSTIKEFSVLCKFYPNSLRIKLKDYGNARGVMMIFRYDTGFHKFRSILTHPEKSNIYKSSIFNYRRELDDKRYSAFLDSSLERLKFVSWHKVYGKFGTAFEYAMNSEWFQQSEWIMEREGLKGKVTRIKGLAGEMDVLNYFTLVVRISDTQVMRVVATWNEAGGTLPLIGKIRSNHEDIFTGIEKGHSDIMEYLVQ